ncbi:MAG: hypothetical protein GXO60_05495 [Epsilonproteobacteria bacterium]|nr:hypothetical protein [Campylobacterota bacterium]
MNEIEPSIDYLPFDMLTSSKLKSIIYPNMFKNYYWSDDFSPQYYIAQAKAGFIAVTENYRGIELLIPEIQYDYAILHFDNLHISKKVKRLIKKRDLKLEISGNLDEVFKGINRYHKNSWFTPKYLKTLYKTQKVDNNFKVISAVIRENNQAIAGEIGYIIGSTYTSLSGFSSKEKGYKNYGTAQLVLLAKYLEENGFSFWNLGQSYMDYKLRLGAKIYSREEFLKIWEENKKNIDNLYI